MTPSLHPSRSDGFSLIELMVTVAIAAIGLALAVPYFGGTATTAKQRGAVGKLVQDFNWSRTAAGVADASTLGVPGATGTPVVIFKLNPQATTNCSWTTTVNNQVDPVHSMTATQMATIAPGLTCGAATDTLALPATFSFTSQGFVDQTGSVSYSSAQSGLTTFWPLLFLTSGSVINTNAAS